MLQYFGADGTFILNGYWCQNFHRIRTFTFIEKKRSHRKSLISEERNFHFRRQRTLLLDHAVEAAIRLVAHAAEELRKLELADAKLKRESDSLAPELAKNEKSYDNDQSNVIM